MKDTINKLKVQEEEKLFKNRERLNLVEKKKEDKTNKLVEKLNKKMTNY